MIGHLGLTPQSINLMGGFKVQGKDMEVARKIIDDALLLEKPASVPSCLRRYRRNWLS